MPPLIDTHLHLGGCISPNFIYNTIINNKQKHLAETYQDVVQAMTFSTNEPRNFHRFLDKFKILDEIKWTQSLIEESVKDICNNLKSQNIVYAWLDFSINKYMNIGWHKIEAIKFIYDAFEKYYPGHVGLILSIKYESPKPSQKQYAKLIEHEDITKYLIGIDLVGDENYFDIEFYSSLLRPWRDLGMMTRAHVGEYGGAENVINSIKSGVFSNIAHGFKILDSDPEDILLAIKNNISFDLAITSNYMTGVVNYQPHPIIDMLSTGLNVTIGSDDPIQCGTTLHDEYQYLKSIGLAKETDSIMMTADYNTRKLLSQQNKLILF